ncbi:hypothetical protein Bca52824_018037 [Brassica carinata]|uniref:Uncharacterized protein n=1 Tax=Brassica carinata TaxID=52824 RepID=A0A8X7VPE4_BRACI|nr:hypothetical protein Bca52824_018037 [Brassica carinata]
MSSVMARLAHQEEVQKTTKDQLAAIVAALNAPASNSQPLRRYLFGTNPTTPTYGVVTNEVEQIGTLADSSGSVRSGDHPRARRAQTELPTDELTDPPGNQRSS